MKVLKILLVIIVVLAGIIAAVGISARIQGQSQYAKYAAVTEEALKEFRLTPYPVKDEYRRVRSFPLMDITVTSRQGDRLARVNSLDATMLQCMKMYTLMIRPSYDYNLPVLSVDFIFLPFGKRVYVIEIIDPAKVDDANKRIYYEKMQVEFAKFKDYPTAGTRDWYKDFLADFSLHITAEEKDDDLLLATYKAYLTGYLEMAKSAKQLPHVLRDQMREGVEKYVSTLLAKGGPAVDVFKKVLGPDGQQEYVRTVMFGLEK